MIWMRFVFSELTILSLRDVIRNQQLGAVTCCSIATEEADEISDIVIVVIYREIQAQLRNTRAVDIQLATSIESGTEPSADRGGIEDGWFDLLGSKVEVSQLESAASKCRIAHIYKK